MSIDDLVKGGGVTGAAFAVSVAMMVVGALGEKDPEGHRLAQEGLRLCRAWLAGERIRAEEIAVYVDDPDEDKDLGLREEIVGDEENLVSVLAVLTLALGMVARLAFDAEGNSNRPTAVWETRPEMLHDLVDFALRTGVCPQAELDALISRFSTWRAGPIPLPDLP